MQQKNVSFRLPEHIMTDLGSREFVADIPWDEIQKIGDVVLLRSKSSDLRGKGYF
jgi:sporulation protein YlmC with PRC-barrel domain